MLTEDAKWIYDSMSSKGYDLQDEKHFEDLLQTEEDAKWIYDESTKIGLDLGDYAHFEDLVGLKNESKLFPDGKPKTFNPSWSNLSWGNIKKQFGESGIGGESSQVARNTAEEEIKKAEEEKKRQEKINIGITYKDRQDMSELVKLEEQAASPVSISADGIMQVNTPQPVLNEYGMPTNITKPTNPDIERQVETKKAQMPKYMLRGENTSRDIADNAYDRAMNTEEGKNLYLSVYNKYAAEYKQSDAYKSLMKDFYAGLATEEDIDNAFYEQYGEKMNKELSEGILGENGIMHEYYKDAEGRLDARLRTVEAFDISSRIQAERDRQYKAFQNSIKSKRDEKGIQINVDVEAFKPDRMLNHAEQFNNDALDLIDAVEKERGFGKGIGNALTDIDTYTAIAELSRTKELIDILDKVEGDEKLSEKEELLLDAALNYFAVSSYYGDKTGRWYRAGQTTGASLPFIAQFMITSGALAGVEASIEGGAKSVGKRIVKNLVKHGHKKFAKALSSKAVTFQE